MIPFIDLKSQYKQIETDVDAAIKSVLEHGEYILGPEVKELEKQLAAYAGSKHCLGCSSGTDALLMALMAYGVGPGDAVFTTPFTFFATAEVIGLLGATPIFVDIDPDTYNIDPALLEQSIKQVRAEGKLKLRGIIPVDIFGLCADYDRILPLAEANDLFVLQDSAQSFGAEYKTQKAPTMGNIGCTSFFPAKPLGCYGDGGAVFTDDDNLFAIMQSILVHGKGSDKYNNVRLGLNARLDTIQAAILLQKLKHYPDEIVRRRQVADCYMEALDGLVKLPVIPSGCRSVWAQFSVRSPRYVQIMEALKQAGVPTARYYPMPLHLSKAFDYLGYRPGDMPVSEAVSSDIFALPMHPYLTRETISDIAQVIQKCI